MAGTKSGGLSAARTNKIKYGSDFYKKIGSLGGSKSRTGGFYANRELARIAGKKGGAISRRTWSKEQKQRQAEVFRHEIAKYREQQKVMA